LFAGFFLAIGLVMVYVMQDKMLYIPDAPNQAFRYPENNPRGYKSPSERNMLYEEVSIVTKDNLTLKGWFIK